jgi:hypothetical protein
MFQSEPLETPSRKRKDNIKMVVRKVCCEDAGIGVGGVETSVYTTRELVSLNGHKNLSWKTWRKETI